MCCGGTVMKRCGLGDEYFRRGEIIKRMELRPSRPRKEAFSSTGMYL